MFLLLATGGRPWDLFERGPFTSDFYDVQARALSRGHLDVPRDVVAIEGFVVDGETHLYYGLAPALVRLPIAAVIEAANGRLVVVSQLAGLAVACLAGARLLARARRALDVDVPERSWQWITGGFSAAIGLSTPLLWLSSRAIVYHEAELWGAALALFGFDRIIEWWESRRTADLVWSSVVAAVALSTRGSSGIGPLLALAGLAVVVAFRRDWRVAGLTVAAAAVPVLLYASVNVARFDSAFSVPFDKQVLNDFSAERRAALAANDGTLFGVEFLPTAALHYLRPDTVTPRALAPWFSWDGRADVIGDVTFDTVDRSASIPVTAPAFAAVFPVGVVVLVRRRLPAPWPISLAAAAAATLPTLTIAFIANRYLADFVPLLVVGAALGVPVIAAWSTVTARRRLAITIAAVALVAVGFVVNGGLALLGRFVYVVPDPAERRDFVAAQYSLHDALGGGRPPSVVEVGELGAVGDDGTVAIVGDCDGLFRSDGSEWSALELRPGGDQRVVVDGSTPGIVASGDGWRIELEAVDDGRRLVYVGPGRVTGPPLTGDGELRVDVQADTSLPRVTVSADGAAQLDAFLQPAGGPVVAGPGWTSRPGRAALCEELRSRLD